jgi:hypothetical protein
MQHDNRLLALPFRIVAVIWPSTGSTLRGFPRNETIATAVTAATTTAAAAAAAVETPLIAQTSCGPKQQDDASFMNIQYS